MSIAAAVYTEEWDRPISHPQRPDLQLAHSTRETPPTVDDTIDAWLAWRPYARTTANRIKTHLQSARACGWRKANGIVTIDQFTSAAAAEYVVYLRDRGASPATQRKVRNLLISLAEFCAETSGYAGLEGDELRKLRLPKLVERIPEALTEDDCLRMIEAVGSSVRDRLIVETFLLTGLRVSELCALTLDSLHLDSRPAFVHIRGSVHDRNRTKNSSERDIIVDYDAYGFGRGYVSRLRNYIASVRPTSHYREVFLADRRETSTGDHTPLTIVGIQRLMTRIERASGVHCNPHRLRHTFCTRSADNGVPMFQLQDALGHKSLDMVRRYYTRSRQAMARGFYHAFGTTYL